ncbi:vWA domain-containing protein [Prosthecobacter sp.]|uniref:vWA domain-containing protein n=1 Tax=Prosthecobacter sp. TaxID=1965333 RepID=UPI001D63C71F|nr:vWA domain-containing protein [Prosthecobacter sp.]MCB1278586.1 VWA domain-containing protein [Prosthecobacter sp.]
MSPQTETTLRFTGGYPPLPVILLAFGLAGLMAWLYRRELKFVTSRFAQVPALLRSLAVFILVIALAGPVLRHVTTLRQLGRVVIAVDSSASMQLTDETADKSAGASKSRFHRAEDLLLKGATPLLKKLAETQDVELVALRGMNTQRLWWYRQGGKDTSGEMPASFELPATSPITNLDQTLRAALGPVTPGTALVVLSDGQHNSTGSPEEFSTALKTSGTSIFTIGFGTEIPPPDLALLGVSAPESVFSKENFQGRITVNDSMPDGVPASVRIESQGKVLWKKDFVTDGKGEKGFDFIFPVTELPPPAPGQRDKTLRSVKIQISASGDRASLEKTRSNNVRELAIHLLDKKRKVLILDGRPRWETRYIHNHFDRDDRWQATLIFDDMADNAANGSLQKSFPKTRDDLLSYDLIILGDAALSRFKAESLDWIVEFVEKRGGGLILIDGQRGKLHEWANGRTAPLIPVRFIGSGGKPQASSIQLTTDGQRFDALRLSDSPSANAALWPTLPKVNWHSNVEPLPAAVTLATAQQPVLVFRQVGAGAVLYLGTDELWRWRFQVADLYHQRLWMQLGAWIAAPPFQIDQKKLSVGTDRLRYAPGEASEIRVRVRNDKGDIITDAQPRAYLLHDGNDVATLQLEADPTHVGVYRALTPPLKAGTYEITVAEGPSAPRSDARLSLHVSDTGNPEWAMLTMNRTLLEAMAVNSGGRFLREEQAATDLPNLLQTLDRKQVITQETILWSSWWWFGAAILLLTVEWLMRKRLKLV